MQFERLKKSHRKEILIGGMILVCVISAITITTTRAKYKLTEDIKIASGTINYKPYDFKIMAMYKSDDRINYSEINEMPESGYVINEEKSYCTTDNVTQVKGKIKTIDGNVAISNLNKNDKCYIWFDKQNYVRGNANALITSGILVNEKGYRYQGSNPNNYVEFNDELWRIIGVFNTKKSDGTSENLIKIIREENILSIWEEMLQCIATPPTPNIPAPVIPGNPNTGDSSNDCHNFNNWNYATLKKLLNEGDYYNRTEGYSTNGLTEKSKEIIENVVWHLGGTSSADITTDTMYEAERSNTVYTGNPTTWTGKVGLMYPSDYGYASPLNTCARNITLSNYGNLGCHDNNWLLKNNYEQWTITALSLDVDTVFYIKYDGGMNTSNVISKYNASPSIYLKSSVQIYAGDGSKDNPYKLK